MLTRTDDAQAVRDHRPFRHVGLIRRTAIFPVALGLAFALYPFGEPDWGPAFRAAVVVAVGSVPLILLTPWDRLPPAAQLAPPFVFLAAILLLREAGGGAASGYTPFTFLPVLWFALYGTRGQLAAAIGAVAIGLGLPILLVGAPEYPDAEWRRVIGVFFVDTTLGWTIQSLVGRVSEASLARLDAERRLRELEAYELHDDVVQSLTEAQLALSLDRMGQAQTAVASALHTTQRIVTRLLGDNGARFAPGGLTRTPKPDADEAT